MTLCFLSSSNVFGLDDRQQLHTFNNILYWIHHSVKQCTHLHMNRVLIIINFSRCYFHLPHVDRLLIPVWLFHFNLLQTDVECLPHFVDWWFLPHSKYTKWALNAIFSLKEIKLCLVQMNGNFGKYRRAALHHACQSLKFHVLLFISCLGASSPLIRKEKMLLIIVAFFGFNSVFFIAMILILSMPVYYIGITIESNYLIFFSFSFEVYVWHRIHGHRVNTFNWFPFSCFSPAKRQGENFSRLR